MLSMHFIPYAEGEGFSSSTAAAAFGVLSGLNVVGLLVTSLLSDKFVRKNVLASVYAMRVLGYIVLLLVPGNWGLWGFVLLLGFSWYSSAPLTTSLTADIYGLKNFGVLNGITFLAHQLGGALGVILAGVLYDINGSYVIPFAIAGALMAAASVAAFSVREKQYSIKYQHLATSTGTSGASAP
jgi:MFS family permease